MFNQSVSIIEFSNLYNILTEVKSLFIFNIRNYENSVIFLNEIESKNIEIINSTIIVNNNNHPLFSNNKINRNNILVIDKFPIKIEILLDKINTHLIKQKYNFQSNLNRNSIGTF